MKRSFKIIVTMILMITSVLMFSVIASAATQQDASKYVNLNGDWNFKLYRTYD